MSHITQGSEGRGRGAGRRTTQGRPRDAAIEGAVLSAARELLDEVGYDAVTMDDTARRAGTSKTAIYRRYRSKAELLFAAVVHDGAEPDAVDPDASDGNASPTPPEPATAATLRGDLLALARRIRAEMSSPAAREVAPRVIAEIGTSPDVAERMREHFVSAEVAQISAIVRRAYRRDEIEHMPDLEAVHRLLGGSLFFSVFVVDRVPTDDELRALVSLIASGIEATPPKPDDAEAPGLFTLADLGVG